MTPTYLSPFPTSSRHICDLSLCVLFIVWRPGLPANLELDWPSRGPRRPSQPSPEQPPARALSAAPEPSRPRALAGPVALYGTPGPVSPIVCPCLQPRCLPHFTLGDAPVWTGPACHPAETSLVARALGPRAPRLSFHWISLAGHRLAGRACHPREADQGALGEQGRRRARVGCMCMPLYVHVCVCVCWGPGEGTHTDPSIHTHTLPELVNCCPISAAVTRPGELRPGMLADLLAPSLLHWPSHSPVWVSVFPFG